MGGRGRAGGALWDRAHVGAELSKGLIGVRGDGSGQRVQRDHSVLAMADVVVLGKGERRL